MSASDLTAWSARCCEGLLPAPCEGVAVARRSRPKAAIRANGCNRQLCDETLADDQSKQIYSLDKTGPRSNRLCAFMPCRYRLGILIELPLQRSFAARVGNARDPAIGAGLAGPWGFATRNSCHNTDTCFGLGHVKDRDIRNGSACLLGNRRAARVGRDRCQIAASDGGQRHRIRRLDTCGKRSGRQACKQGQGAGHINIPISGHRLLWSKAAPHAVWQIGMNDAARAPRALSRSRKPARNSRFG